MAEFIFFSINSTDLVSTAFNMKHYLESIPYWSWQNLSHVTELL